MSNILSFPFPLPISFFILHSLFTLFICLFHVGPDRGLEILNGPIPVSKLLSDTCKYSY